MSFFLALGLYDKLKVGGAVILITLALIFLGVRGCNKTEDKINNENTPINKIITTPTDKYDELCVFVSGQPCPKIGQ